MVAVTDTPDAICFVYNIDNFKGRAAFCVSVCRLFLCNHETLIGEFNGQSLVQEGHLLETSSQGGEVKGGGFKDFVISPEGDGGAGVISGFIFGKFGLWNTVHVGLAIDRFVAAHFNIKLLGKCIHYRDAHAV
ncbi:unannotated protein [freshwater metagenome]|uniref:Unannotated protein n=1 Tax=freshwater metagenome TaxID=449393 RepID=A0A6J7SG69_9ZZZZ